MGNDVAEAAARMLSPSSIKVHRLMCTDLMKLVDKITDIFPEIEAARPRCSSGMQSLCLLNSAIDKANLVFRHCSESSKLYLAITRDTILSRCERSRRLLEQSLSQLQNMVPITLAIEISQIIDELRSTEFILDSSEEEAGKVLQALFEQKMSTIEKSEIEALQFAALRLHITSSRALVLEKRSLKRLLDKFNDSDPTKNRILYLYYLVKKYGKALTQTNTTNEDPASKWCMDHNSCNEAESVNSWNTFPVSDFSNVSLGSSENSYVLDSSHVEPTSTNVRRTKFLSELNLLPWESHRKVVEDVKSFMDYNDQAFDFITSENFIEPLIKFLKDARDTCDTKCQKSGCRLLLMFVEKKRNKTPYMPEDMFHLLSTLLDYEVTGEALAIMVVLSDGKNWNPKLADSRDLYPILKILDSQTSEHQEPAIKILFNLSTNEETRAFIRSSDLVPKLVPILYNGALAKYAIKILRNLCHNEEDCVSIAETNGCVASIAELLSTGSHEDQEHAVTVLLSMCTHCKQYCKLVMDEGIILALCSIGINGNERGRMGAKELLRLVKETTDCAEHERSGADANDYRESAKSCTKKKSGIRTYGIGKTLSNLTKFTSFSSRKKI